MAGCYGLVTACFFFQKVMLYLVKDKWMGRYQMRRKGLSFTRRRRNKNGYLVKEAGSWLLHLVIPVFFAVVIVYFLGMRTSVIGASMEGTLYGGEQILVSRLSYLLTGPREGDIIVFRPGGNKNTHSYVKRVVAGPGDSVEIKEGKLFVNDEVVNYGYDKIMDPGIAETKLILSNDEYFVMGDNCNNSEDSRSGNIGPVTKAMIEGKAWFQFGSEASLIGFIE